MDMFNFCFAKSVHSIITALFFNKIYSDGSWSYQLNVAVLEKLGYLVLNSVHDLIGLVEMDIFS